VDTEERIPPVLEEVERTCAQRVARATRLNVVIVDELRVRVGLALDHLVGRTPGRPFLLHRDLGRTGEFKTGAAYANAITAGNTRLSYMIEEMRAWQDKNLARNHFAFDPDILGAVDRVDLESLGRCDTRGSQTGSGGGQKVTT
jgi:hypothetical protein